MRQLNEFYRDWIASRPVEPVVLKEPIPLEELHTPALVIDLDAFEANLDRMQSHLDDAGIRLRPHTKMHKCPIIARQQVERGAVGVCAAKLAEAEVMCAAGVDNVLITSPLASVDKLERFIALRSAYPGVQLAVDHPETVQHLDRLSAAHGLVVDVYLDIDPAMGRTGIAAGEPALELAKQVVDTGNLRLVGLQMYAGHCMHIEGYEARAKRYRDVMAAGAETRDLLQSAGIDVPVFSGGGTGTYDIEPGLGLVNELQAGSYAFMDIEYRDIGSQQAELFDDFDVSLFVLVTAISQPQSRLITVDAGFKSLASDKMAPEFRDVEGVVYHWGGDEHGIVQLSNPSKNIALGDKLEVLTPHCDPTVNLHDFYFPYRDGMVREVWPITARGLSQ